MISQEGQRVQTIFTQAKPKRTLASYQKFRIRSVSTTKYDNTKQATTNKTEAGVIADGQQSRSNSLKLVRRWRYETKQTEANVDSQEEDKVGRQRNLRTEETRVEILKKREIAKIFNPKTIMKMGRRKSQFSHETNDKELKDEGKQKFRLKKYFIENSQPTEKEKKQPDSSEEYWRKVNQSLILAQAQNDQTVEISKDLRQLYDEL